MYGTTAPRAILHPYAFQLAAMIAGTIAGTNPLHNARWILPLPTASRLQATACRMPRVSVAYVCKLPTFSVPSTTTNECWDWCSHAHRGWGCPDAAWCDEHVLVELHEKRGVQRAPTRGAFGLFHFAMLLPSRADLGRFVAHVASLGVRLGAADQWVSEAVYLTDPDGLGIEVCSDRPRSQWQLRGRELAMSTEALDLDPWGTRLRIAPVA